MSALSRLCQRVLTGAHRRVNNLWPATIYFSRRLRMQRTAMLVSLQHGRPKLLLKQRLVSCQRPRQVEHACPATSISLRGETLGKKRIRSTVPAQWNGTSEILESLAVNLISVDSLDPINVPHLLSTRHSECWRRDRFYCLRVRCSGQCPQCRRNA
jgi:hypothetical protein